MLWGGEGEGSSSTGVAGYPSSDPPLLRRVGGAYLRVEDADEGAAVQRVGHLRRDVARNVHLCGGEVRSFDDGRGGMLLLLPAHLRLGSGGAEVRRGDDVRVCDEARQLGRRRLLREDVAARMGGEGEGERGVGEGRGGPNAGQGMQATHRAAAATLPESSASSRSASSTMPPRATFTMRTPVLQLRAGAGGTGQVASLLLSIPPRSYDHPLVSGDPPLPSRAPIAPHRASVSLRSRPLVSGVLGACSVM